MDWHIIVFSVTLTLPPLPSRLRYTTSLKLEKPIRPNVVDPKNPLGWTHDQLSFWIASIDPLFPVSKVLQRETGAQFVRLSEDEFLYRCSLVKSPKITPDRAKSLYSAFWELAVDARQKQRQKQRHAKKAS